MDLKTRLKYTKVRVVLIDNINILYELLRTSMYLCIDMHTCTQMHIYIHTYVLCTQDFNINSLVNFKQSSLPPWIVFVADLLVFPIFLAITMLKIS